MLARAATALPPAGQEGSLLFQPKIDGFRVLVYVRDGRVFLQSRNGADLTAAFPEISAAGGILGEDLVLDGELVAIQRVGADAARVDFRALQDRARRRGRGAAAAAATAPAHVVVFDALEVGGRVLLDLPYRARLRALDELFTRHDLAGTPWTLITTTSDPAVAQRWLDPVWAAAGVEGVVAKAAGSRYRPAQRGWTKVRSYDTCRVSKVLHAF